MTPQFDLADRLRVLLPVVPTKAAGRIGSHRVGGHGSNGKGSHYVGGRKPTAISRFVHRHL